MPPEHFPLDVPGQLQKPYLVDLDPGVAVGPITAEDQLLGYLPGRQLQIPPEDHAGGFQVDVGIPLCHVDRRQVLGPVLGGEAAQVGHDERDLRVGRGDHVEVGHLGRVKQDRNLQRCHHIEHLPRRRLVQFEPFEPQFPDFTSQ